MSDSERGNQVRLAGASCLYRIGQFFEAPVPVRQDHSVVGLCLSWLHNPVDAAPQRRALREQLSAAINLVVERIELHPMGHNAQGCKEDRFADVMFKNGASRRIESGEC